jgi:hypothetical protein
MAKTHVLPLTSYEKQLMIQSRKANLDRAVLAAAAAWERDPSETNANTLAELVRDRRGTK